MRNSVNVNVLRSILPLAASGAQQGKIFAGVLKEEPTLTRRTPNPSRYRNLRASRNGVARNSKGSSVYYDSPCYPTRVFMVRNPCDGDFVDLLLYATTLTVVQYFMASNNRRGW